MNEAVKNTLKALENNNMTAIFAEDKHEVLNIVKDMLFDGSVISSGGSVSLSESGVFDLIKDSRYNFKDRKRAGITPEEQLTVFKDIIGCDFYFCSANAVTENGELINVDGYGNRITALTFGPKKVVVVVGVNKIVPDVKAGFLRVKQTAAPKNCLRLNLNNPCTKLGHCIALEKSVSPDIADGCNSPTRICRTYQITSKQQDKNRITVIICGEDLGY